MKNIGKIYKIENLINQKVYIGQTIQSLEQRYRDHKSNAKKRRKDSKSKLYVAMRKYGIENFKISLVEDNIPISQLNEKEEIYIIQYKSVEEGYNIKYREEKIRTIKNLDVSIIIDLYKKGKSLKCIAEKYKADKRTISSILRENNIEIRNWNKEQSNCKISKECLNDLYINKEISSNQIGKLFNLSGVAIRNWLIKFNIPIRNSNELKIKYAKCRTSQ